MGGIWLDIHVNCLFAEDLNEEVLGVYILKHTKNIFS